MIVDACLFAGEREMLQLRLLTLGSLVSAYVVVACTVTHQGEPADVGMISGAFHEATAMARLTTPVELCWVEPSMVLERRGCVHERAPEERGPAGSMWFQHIERQHRDGIRDAVGRFTDDPKTIVMMSDVDEIPDPGRVAELNYWGVAPEQLNERLVFQQRFHSTALDLLHPQQPWLGTCVARLAACEPQKHRDLRGTVDDPRPQVVPVGRGGWHFSWFGTDRDRARKLETFSHAELLGTFDPADGRRALYHANGERLRKLNLAETWALDWPVPLLNGQMPLPECWLTDDMWRPAS